MQTATEDRFRYLVSQVLLGRCAIHVQNYEQGLWDPLNNPAVLSLSEEDIATYMEEAQN